MLDATLERPTGSTRGAFQKAVVEETLQGGTIARVRPEAPGFPDTVDAELALSERDPPGPGDRVLLAWSPAESFVIAVLRRETTPDPPVVRLSDGASVRLDGPVGEERVRLFSPDDELVLEYDPSAGRLRLNAPAGDLELSSAEGDIVLNAARTVRLEGGRVEAVGETGVHVGVSDGPGAPSIRLDRGSTRLSTPSMAVTSRRAALDVERTRFTGEEVHARVGSLRLVAERIERAADVVHERANRVYQTVKEALHLRTKRLRSVVRDRFHLEAGKVHMKSDDRFKIKADRIHLG